MMRPSRSMGVRLGLCLVVLGVAAGCTSASPEANPTTTTVATAPTTPAPGTTTTASPEEPGGEEPAPGGGILVIAETNPPNTFDPIGHSNLNNWYAWQLVYEGLVEALPTGEIAPLLAEEWEVSDDGLTYTFRLRDGVLFHNGQPLEADDVVYSFERLATEGIPYAQARFPSLASVVAIDLLTVEFTLSSPDSSFLTNLADPFAVANSILNREAAASSSPAIFMVGTGPFRMVSYAPERELLLEANDDYWRSGIPRVSELHIRYLPEQSSQLAALRTGQVHLMFPSPETALVAPTEPNVELLAVSTAQSFQINMGSVDLPLSDVNVRRAIALSIDREELVALALLGEGSPSGPFPPEHPWAVPLADQQYYQRDVVEARSLLTEAGYPDGIELSFMWPAGFDEVGDRIGEVLQSQFAESGITLQLEPLETAVWLDRLVSANYDLTWTAPPYFADPMQYVVPRAGRQGPTPDELGELFSAARAATTAEQLGRLYRDIQLKQAELVYPFTGLVAKNGWVGFRSDMISGVEVDYTLSRRLLFSVAVGSS